ncbi:hypothetical protein F4780DRAFT_490981 [Xylariomycetidae sp. FL0641]|nr:hypothetical protein F4780DRAFT_490981 [Xylariomycetidae sp. FL0641]
METQTPPKSMSSRLLTMKFMQRAAASPSSTPTTPASEEQSSKRRKTSHSSTPQHDVDTLVNQRAVQAAIAEDERKREEALLKHASAAGDARWVLELPKQAAASGRTAQTPLNVVQVGFSQIDSPDGDSNESSRYDHTQPFRRYNMGKKKQPQKQQSDSEDSSGDSDSDSDASSDNQTSGRQSFGSQSPARKVLQSKKSTEQARAQQFAEKRRKKDVKLNQTGSAAGPAGGGLSSISSGGGTTKRAANFSCFKCGQPGHKAPECKRGAKGQQQR